MTATRIWRPGDRVLLTPTGHPDDYTGAVVERVDEVGVHLRLDRQIRGINTACAGPGELLSESHQLACTESPLGAQP